MLFGQDVQSISRSLDSYKVSNTLARGWRLPRFKKVSVDLRANMFVKEFGILNRFHGISPCPVFPLPDRASAL
jgi:hypothetical protein